MRWTAPPTRRELILLIFSLVLFTLAFNFDTSVEYFGIDAVTAQRQVLLKLGFSPRELLRDGRRPPGWRDRVDDIIFGNWSWYPGQAASEDVDAGQELGVGEHMSMWMGKAQRESLWPPTDEPSVREGFWRWGEQVPKTTLLKHVPGYTMLDQVIILNWTVYIVTDHPESFPSTNLISIPRESKWEVISTEAAKSTIGQYGGRMRGVTWISPNSTPQNTTLLTLWSLYSTLHPSIPINGRTSLPPPSRLVFPHTPVFSDPDYNRNHVPEYWLPRQRSDTGFHPFLAKSAFPQMGILYKEDWADYMDLQVPYVLERVVVADYEMGGVTGMMSVLELAEAASEYWWEPIRRNLAVFFEVYDEPSSKPRDARRWTRVEEKRGVTYVYRKGAVSERDHENLVRVLRKKGEEERVEVNVVEAVDQDGNMEWGERLGAVVRSNIIISAQGPDILDGVFLRPSPETTVVELFPPNTASHERQVIAKSLGMTYIAWSGNRKLSSTEIENLSMNSPNSNERGHDLSVDADTLVRTIWDTLKR